MNESYYIGIDDYNIIRKGLLDKNNNVIKTSIQNLITQLEEGMILFGNCKGDLCSILYKIVQSDDYKIRKWTYHLIAYEHTPDLVFRCIKNLTEGIENDDENITWIFAIASIILSKQDLLNLFRSHAENQISRMHFRLCTIVFSNFDININARNVRKILDSNDFLSKMWLTKIYACNYRIVKKKQYVKIVNHKVMNELLQDDKMDRYALWAFSTYKSVNINKIEIRSYDAVKLPDKSKAWFYNCLFKDKNYVNKHRDHIEVILDDFFRVPFVVQGGILRGLEGIDYNLGYMVRMLIQIYCALDEKNVEDISLKITLTQIYLKHVKESNDLRRILRDVKITTKIDAIKHILLFYKMEEERGMARTINMFGQNQYNEKAKTITQNNLETSFDNRPVIYTNQINEILRKLKDGDYNDIINTHDVELNNLITNLEYELSYSKSVEKTAEIEVIKKKIDELEMSVTDLKNDNTVDKRTKFSNVLTKFSQLCTVITSVPKLIDMAQNIMVHISTFLNI